MGAGAGGRPGQHERGGREGGGRLDQGGGVHGPGPGGRGGPRGTGGRPGPGLPRQPGPRPGLHLQARLHPPQRPRVRCGPVPVCGAALQGAGRGGSASLLAVQETGRASGLLSRPRRICTALLFAAVPSAEARLSGRFVAAVVSIINKDETYSKGVFGEVAFRKPRGNTFCNATLLPKQPVVLVVEDALSDERHGPSGLHGSFDHVAKSGEGQWALQQAHAMWLSGSRTSPRSKRPRTLCDSMPELR